MKTLWNYLMFSFVGIVYWAGCVVVAQSCSYWGVAVVWLALMWIPYSVTYDNIFKDKV